MIYSSSIKQSLLKAANMLKLKGIISASLEAKLLLQHALDKSTEYLLINADENLSKEVSNKFWSFVDRRLKFEPIAYILGSREFYSRKFIVSKDVLIPRADTELLIDIAKKICCGKELKEILELGTGSGCIAISLLVEIPCSILIATDISPGAIKIAQLNASWHKVEENIQIIQSNWFEELLEKKFDLIVSNPPYIAKNEIADIAIETLNYEPFIALFAKKNGLDAYYTIAENAKRFLKPHGKLIIEIGYTQSLEVSRLFKSHGYTIHNIYKDLQQHDRVLEISY